MRKLLSSVAILAAVAAPIALHATPITGQFSLTGPSVVNDGTTLTFSPNSVSAGAANTLTGSFASLLAPGQAGGITSSIDFANYVANSARVSFAGSVNFSITSITETVTGSGVDVFVADGTLSSPQTGFNSTAGDLIFTTQGAGAATFSATINGAPVPPPAVPEPSTLALFGTGLFGIVGFAKRRLS
jgi:hypothetical protein